MMERFYRLEAGLDDKEFLPRYFEVRFGQGEDIPPLKITLTGGDVIYINGKIDRIDAKTGKMFARTLQTSAKTSMMQSMKVVS